MKKNGFTLSELIITLSIIGVASALMMPAITKAMPDKNKTKILGIHSKLASAVNTVVEDDAIYWCLDYPENTPAQDKFEGLSCEYRPRRAPFNNSDYENENKFENLLKYQLGLEDLNAAWNGFTYSTPDGVYWRIERGCSNIDTNVFTAQANGACNPHNSFSYRITVDVNGNSTPNTLYSPNMRRSLMPDRFRFRVDNYGSLTPDDAMSASYLKNSTRASSKKDDKRDAGILYDRHVRYRSN